MARTVQRATAVTSALEAAEAALLATTGVDVERGYVEAGGLRLHYLACGSGEPLLLVHGRGASGATFAPVLALLTAERRVLTVDLPGWGLSEKPPFRGRTAHDALRVWMDGVCAFLDSQGLAQIDYLGHSMGGFTGLGLALERPERIRRLALSDPGGLGTYMPFVLRLYFRLKPERLHRWLGPGFTRFTVRQGAPGHVLPSAERFRFERAVVTQAAIIPSGGRAYDAWINLSGVHLSFADRAADLALPVLVIWGGQDIVTPYHDGAAAVARMTTARLVMFPSAGHTPFQEQPAAFAHAVLEFLRET
jgi:pimeloyl-ACP methyl ester carboxylesterase